MPALGRNKPRSGHHSYMTSAARPTGMPPAALTHVRAATRLRTPLGNKKPQASACRTHRHGPAPPNACEADVLLICQERESSDSPMLKAF
jgi:hypothetical protein